MKNLTLSLFVLLFAMASCTDDNMVDIEQQIDDSADTVSVELGMLAPCDSSNTEQLFDSLAGQKWYRFQYLNEGGSISFESYEFRGSDLKITGLTYTDCEDKDPAIDYVVLYDYHFDGTALMVDFESTGKFSQLLNVECLNRSYFTVIGLEGTGEESEPIKSHLFSFEDAQNNGIKFCDLI